MTTQKQTIEDIPNYLRPMMVGPIKSETDEQWAARHKKFKSLDDDIQEILASDETAKIIAQIANKYKFDETQIRNVARAVRLYYFSELPADEIASYLETNIPVQQKVAEAITATLMRKIIHNENILPRETTTVKDALEKYEDLRNQMVTNRDIIVYGTQSLARPTIGHWLTDYHLSVGQGEHSSIQRGNYLFHNKNAEQLSDAERQRLAIILKSWDENIPLVVDPTKQQIVFPAQKVVSTSKQIAQNKAGSTAGSAQNTAQANKKTLPGDAQRLPQSVLDKVTAAKITPQKAVPQRTVSQADKVASGLATNATKPISLQSLSTRAQSLNKNDAKANAHDIARARIKTAIKASQVVATKKPNTINPMDLRNRHLTKSTNSAQNKPQSIQQVRNIPTQLPIVSPTKQIKPSQFAQINPKQPSGFVSFSSKQKLPTEDKN